MIASMFTTLALLAIILATVHAFDPVCYETTGFPANRCLTRNHVCFGVKNGIKSNGSSGCINDGDWHLIEGTVFVGKRGQMDL